MSAIPVTFHRFRELLEADATRIFRILFRDGGALRLRSFSVVDPSIYPVADQWTAVVVEHISGRHPDCRRLHRSGSGIDFLESDVAKIFSDITGERFYVA